jgi:hypothetical protein
MNQIRRRVSTAINPVSTAVTSWWCHSALRHMLTGNGPKARHRWLMRRRALVIRHETQNGLFEPLADQRAERMRERAKAIDDLLVWDNRRDAD